MGPTSSCSELGLLTCGPSALPRLLLTMLCNNSTERVRSNTREGQLRYILKTYSPPWFPPSLEDGVSNFMCLSVQRGQLCRKGDANMLPAAIQRSSHRSCTLNFTLAPHLPPSPSAVSMRLQAYRIDCSSFLGISHRKARLGFTYLWIFQPTGSPDPSPPAAQ